MEDSVKVVFSKRLRQLRRDKNITMETISSAVGISEPVYTSYESAIREPSYKTLVALSRYLNVTTDYLLGNDSKLDEDTYDILETLREVLLVESKEGVFFNGQPVKEETLGFIKDSIRYLSDQANRLSKVE